MFVGGCEGADVVEGELFDDCELHLSWEGVPWMSCEGGHCVEVMLSAGRDGGLGGLYLYSRIPTSSGRGELPRIAPSEWEWEHVSRGRVARACARLCLCLC